MSASGNNTLQNNLSFEIVNISYISKEHTAFVCSVKKQPVKEELNAMSEINFRVL